MKRMLLSLRRLKLKDSLLSQYLLLVLSAMVVLPAALLLVSMLITFAEQGTGNLNPSQAGHRLESIWHTEAAALDGASPEQVDRTLERLRTAYPESRMFWVDREGATRLTLPEQPELPRSWSPADAIRFMKQRTEEWSLFTVVAFIGRGTNEGFMVFEIPREQLQGSYTSRNVWYITGLAVVLASFLAISAIFFYRIRSRLVRLQQAMALPEADGIPQQVASPNGDEIGRLEKAFNDMVRQLADSRDQTAREEQLRRDLIAKLSHDLRTPLTAIRGHAYTLQREVSSERGRTSVELIERKTDYLAQLLDNLLSYSLLSAGKYPYHPQRVDVVRLVRIHFAGWYPVFEQAGFEIVSDLPESPLWWEADPQRLERVLDNVLQNVLRHASAGRYVAIRISPEEGGKLQVEDRGPGMDAVSGDQGAGIGLSIASLMLKDMKLRASVRSGPDGTVIRVEPESESGNGAGAEE